MEVKLCGEPGLVCGYSFLTLGVLRERWGCHRSRMTSLCVIRVLLRMHMQARDVVFELACNERLLAALITGQRDCHVQSQREQS